MIKIKTFKRSCVADGLITLLPRLVGMFLLITAGCTFAAQSVSTSKSFYQAHARVDLISPAQSIKLGEPVWIGLRLKMDDQWHVYWKNPGDSGLQPSIKWNFPQGFAETVGEIQWPTPKRIDIPPLTSYGYEGQVILFTQVQVPKQFTDTELIIKAKVEWLACKIECIPGRTDLELRLPVKKQNPKMDPILEKAFNETQKKWPLTSTNIEVQAYEKGDEIFLKIGPASLINPNSQIYFFPDRSDIIKHAAEQILQKNDNTYVLTIKKSPFYGKPLESLSGILLNESGWENKNYPQALTINSTVELNQSPLSGIPSTNLAPPQNSTMTLVVACIFALLGGLILNLMPCVLPVLSLKILHLVEHSRNKKKSLNNGLIFGAGIIVSFWVLAIVLILLRSLGSAIGWGFQFQSPAFVVLIALILFSFALNLFGLFEVGTGLTSLGNSMAVKNGYKASFCNGVLATIVATPCTAPFMGSALSFALSRSAIEAFLVFTFLGIGMALPVVILSLYPKLLKIIPKPGPWMNTLKAVLGFILLGSVIWLIWVFGMQKGISGITSLLLSFLFFGIGLYFYGKSQTTTKKSLPLIYTIFVFIIAGLLVSWNAIRQPVPANGTSPTESVVAATELPWQNYSAQLIEELKSSGKPFFLDFTAAWCLSCQVNDRLALSDRRVVKAFLDHKITAVKADWTNNDPSITSALASYGRNSIPLYVLYPGGGVPPVFLPEIITADTVLDFLQIHLKE